MTLIHCDSCGFEFQQEFKDIPKLFNKRCPECGDKSICNKKDIAAWALMNLGIKAGVMRETQKDEDAAIIINTANL